MEHVMTISLLRKTKPLLMYYPKTMYHSTDKTLEYTTHEAYWKNIYRESAHQTRDDGYMQGDGHSSGEGRITGASFGE